MQVTIDIPEVIADAGAGERARLLLVLDAVRSERLSSGDAASALGLSRDGLAQLARAHGVPLVHYGLADLEHDLQTIDVLFPKPRA